MSRELDEFLIEQMEKGNKGVVNHLYGQMKKKTNEDN